LCRNWHFVSVRMLQKKPQEKIIMSNTVGSYPNPNVIFYSDFLAHRTATDRLSFWKIPHHSNGISVKNVIWREPWRTKNAFYSFI
jgi:hypothetical protein